MKEFGDLDYQEYEDMLFQKIYSFQDLEKRLIDEENFECAMDVVLAQDMLFENISSWYLQKSPITEKLIKDSYSILYGGKDEKQKNG